MINFSIKYRRILVAISLLFFIFSCQERKISETNTPENIQYRCKIFSTSNSPTNNLVSSDLWISSRIPQDDIIIFAFDSLVYINNIVVKQSEKQNFDNITKIRVYSNNGIIGDFIPEKIKVNQVVGFLILKIEQTQNFHLTKFYKDSFEYKIAFPELNKACAIENILFFAEDSVQINLDILPNNNSNLEINFDIFFPDKIVNYSGFKKSISLSTSGELFGFSRNSFTDTIYHGRINENGNLAVSKLIFSKNKFKSERITAKFSHDEFVFYISSLPKFYFDFEDDFFVDVNSLDTTIVKDIRYATANNFTEQVIYDCPKCWMRYGAAKDFVKAEQEFLSKGYRIKVFDCYRPHSAQYKLWEILPNKNYVANPQRGSIHNRGAAVDMTLVDSLGKELDMGTEFDFFGLKAYSIFYGLPDTVLKNRKLMWSVMHKYGFKEIKTEWWHLSHYSCMKYPISDISFRCE